MKDTPEKNSEEEPMDEYEYPEYPVSKINTLMGAAMGYLISKVGFNCRPMDAIEHEDHWMVSVGLNYYVVGFNQRVKIVRTIKDLFELRVEKGTFRVTGPSIEVIDQKIKERTVPLVVCPFCAQDVVEIVVDGVRTCRGELEAKKIQEQIEKGEEIIWKREDEDT